MPPLNDAAGKARILTAIDTRGWRKPGKPRCRCKTLPDRSIRFFVGGLTITGGSHHRHWPLCFATSIRRCWLGRCVSSSASRLTRSGRASFFSSLLLRVPTSSYTGDAVWSVRLLDGSAVSREAHAVFCERLEVRFLRPTHPTRNRRLQPSTTPGTLPSKRFPAGISRAIKSVV